MSALTDKFDRWLRERGYQESTINESLRDARLIEVYYSRGAQLPKRVKWTGKRLIAAGLATGALRAQIEALSEKEIGGYGGRRKRKSVLRSVDDETWRKLAQAVTSNTSDEARVIEVMMAHGKRVGDVLRVEREELRRAIRTGTLEHTVKGGGTALARIDDSWKRLWEAWQADKDNKGAQNVAGWLCPTNPSPLPGAGAYKRVQRKLKSIARLVGIDERMFLHRLRRTVAVQALRSEKDIGAVQQLLGHASPQTTARYLDEARPEAVAEVQRRVKKRFLE